MKELMGKFYTIDNIIIQANGTLIMNAESKVSVLFDFKLTNLINFLN